MKAPSELRRLFGTGVAWSLVVTVGGQGSTLLTNIVVANVLGIEGFGRYAMILSTVQSMSQLSGLGTGYTATRYISEFRTSDPARAGRVIALCAALACAGGFVAGFGLLVASDVVATSAFKVAQLSTPLRVAALAVAAGAINGFLVGTFAGLGAYRSLAFASVASGTIYLGAGFAGVWIGGFEGSVRGLAVASVAQVVINAVFLISAARAANIRLSLRDLSAERWIVRRFTLPTLAFALTAVPALWGTQVFVLRQVGGVGQLAIYNACFTLMMLVLILPSIATTVGMSLINGAMGERDAHSYREGLVLNLCFGLLAAIVGGAIVLMLASPLLHVFGTEFVAGRFLLPVLLAAALAEVATLAINQVIQTHERGWTAIGFINVPRDLTLVITAAVLAPRLGGLGAAIAYLASRVVSLVATASLVARIGLQPPVRTLSSIGGNR